MLSHVLGQRGCQGWVLGCVVGGGPGCSSKVAPVMEEAWERGVLQQPSGCGGIPVTPQVLPLHLHIKSCGGEQCCPSLGRFIAGKGVFLGRHTQFPPVAAVWEALIYASFSSSHPRSSAERLELQILSTTMLSGEGKARFGVKARGFGVTGGASAGQLGRRRRRVPRARRASAR